MSVFVPSSAIVNISRWSKSSDYRQNFNESASEMFKNSSLDSCNGTMGANLNYVMVDGVMISGEFVSIKKKSLLVHDFIFPMFEYEDRLDYWEALYKLDGLQTIEGHRFGQEMMLKLDKE